VELAVGEAREVVRAGAVDDDQILSRDLAGPGLEGVEGDGDGALDVPLEVLRLAPHVDDLRGRAFLDQGVQLGNLDDLECGRRRGLGNALGRGSHDQHGAQHGQDQGEEAKADRHAYPPRIGSVP
jgi:hypothetical protein